MIKLIQINSFHFKFFDQLVDFIKREDPDIVNIQEIAEGSFSFAELPETMTFERLKTELNMQGIYIPWLKVHRDNKILGTTGIGFLTKYKIIDHSHLYSSEKHSPTIVPEDESPYIMHRPIDFMDIPHPVLYAILETGDGLIRNVTVHYPSSSRTTEITQMTKFSRYIRNFIDSSMILPTILSGDFNIEIGSVSIETLCEVMNLVDINSRNTLNPRIHKGFKRDLVDGLRIDHILQKGFVTKKAYVADVDVSDHLPVIAELTLKN